MNFIKRAFFSLVYHKKNTLLLFAVFFVLAILVLTAFSMLEACKLEEKELRENIGATVTVNDYAVQDGDMYRASCLISQGSLDAMQRHTQVESSNPYYFSMARGSSTISPVVMEEQGDKFPSYSNLMRIEGTLDLNTAAEFISGQHGMLRGRGFESGDSFAAVISEDVALQNGIAVGDTVTLGGYYSQFGGVDTEVKVVGIYAIREYLPHTNAPYFNSENLVYVTPDAAMQLNGPEAGVYSARFFIRDPEQAAAFVEDVQAMDLPKSADLRFTIDDLQYRAMQGTISSLTSIAIAMLVASSVIGAITLVLLLLIALKNRDFELGVLLSMGEARAKILSQLVLESLFPVLASTTGAVFAAPYTQQAVNLLFSGALAHPVTATVGAIAAVYVSGVMLTLLASSVTAFKLCRCQPKKVLMAAG